VVNTAYYNPVYFTSFGIAAVFVCLTCFVYMVLERHYEKLQSKLFIAIIFDIIIAAVVDVTSEMIGTHIQLTAATAVLQNMADYVYFITHTALAPLFCLYVLAVCGGASRPKWSRIVLVGIPFFIAEALALSNPLTGWVYSYSQGGMVFVRHWAVYVLYGVGVLYFVVGLVYLLSRWRALDRVKRRALIYFFVMVGVGVGVQFAFPLVRVELFAEALAITGVMMFVENEDEFRDSELGVYNRRALKMNLDMQMSSGSVFYVIDVRVTNADAYAHLGNSSDAMRFLTCSVADYLKELMPWYHVYRTGLYRFALVDPSLSAEEARVVAERVSSRFLSSWQYRDSRVDLNCVVALACVPHDLATVDDIFYLVDTRIPAQPGKQVLAGSDLNFLMRRMEVERAVRCGLDEGNYEMYYQPICGSDGVVNSAEALMRLTDKQLGPIPPFEFIEVAERIGLIEEIGDFALREVCAFLASGIPQKYGVNHISVNLSVIQCMQVGFTAHVKDTVGKYNVSPDLLTFEITESVAAGDYEFLSRMVDRLKQSGYHFAMDDYGTGYSNMHSLLALDFDVVKIDKSVLWDAEKSPTGMVVLESSVNMMRNVGRSVLVEGVESESQVNTLRRLGVDYYQGFYFARPMPRDEFVEFIAARR